MHITFSDIGEAIAEGGWGREWQSHEAAVSDVLSGTGAFGDSKRTLLLTCLLASVCHEIKELRMEIRGLSRSRSSPTPPSESANPLSDGMIAVLRGIPDISVRDMNLSVRARKTCLRAGIETLAQLSAARSEDLSNVKHCGFTTMNELRLKLADYGLSFSDSEATP